MSILISAPEEESNFLVPNATFFVELFAFLIILFVLARYVIPPINKAMTERQQRIEQQFAEGEEAKARAEAAEQEYKDALTGARQEASRLREEAREQGASIIAEMRTQAQAESSRILTAARGQLEAERQQVMNQLRIEIGTLATSLASRVVGESLEDEARQRRVVERFLLEMEAQSDAAAEQRGSDDTPDAAPSTGEAPTETAAPAQSAGAAGDTSSSGERTGATAVGERR
jgi:F-type H+-transporting ATPase subunit b